MLQGEDIMPTSIVITCPSCGSGNRIPPEKEGKHGRCGNCQAALPLMYRSPHQLDSGSFETFLANYSGPVLAEFWAPWCPHCVSYAPTVRTVAEKLAGKAAIVQINTQENPALASRFGVRGIPLIILLRNGRVVDQLDGARSEEDILAWFQRHA